MSRYSFYARAIVVIHFLWTFLLFGGGVLVAFYHPYAPYQIAVMTFTILMWFPFGMRCSLTVLARHFEKKAGTYDGNEKPFMAKHLGRILKKDLDKKKVGVFIALFYIASYVFSILVLAGR